MSVIMVHFPMFNLHHKALLKKKKKKKKTLHHKALKKSPLYNNIIYFSSPSSFFFFGYLFPFFPVRTILLFLSFILQAYVKIWIEVLLRTRKRSQMQALMTRVFEGSTQAKRQRGREAEH